MRDTETPAEYLQQLDRLINQLIESNTPGTPHAQAMSNATEALQWESDNPPALRRELDFLHGFITALAATGALSEENKNRIVTLVRVIEPEDSQED